MHEKKDLDRIQDEAARIVTGATKLVSLMLLHNDVCWDLLQERKHKLIQKVVDRPIILTVSLFHFQFFIKYD